MIYNSITAEYVLWINYLAPALSPLISYPDVITIADSPKISDTDDDTVADACIHVHADADQHVQLAVATSPSPIWTFHSYS